MARNKKGAAGKSRATAAERREQRLANPARKLCILTELDKIMAWDRKQYLKIIDECTAAGIHPKDNPLLELVVQLNKNLDLPLALAGAIDLDDPIPTGRLRAERVAAAAAAPPSIPTPE